MKTRLCFALLFTLVGCGTPGRPVGLPPPEYEQPHVEPWPPASAEAPRGGAVGGSGGTATPNNDALGVGLAPEAPAGARGNSGGTSATLSPGTP